MLELSRLENIYLTKYIETQKYKQIEKGLTESPFFDEKSLIKAL